MQVVRLALSMKAGVIQVQGRRFTPRWPVECPLYKPVFIASLHELVNGWVILVATNFAVICCKFWGLDSAFQVFWLDTLENRQELHDRANLFCGNGFDVRTVH
jgi:hypothetical protein